MPLVRRETIAIDLKLWTKRSRIISYNSTTPMYSVNQTRSCSHLQ